MQATDEHQTAPAVSGGDLSQTDREAPLPLVDDDENMPLASTRATANKKNDYKRTTTEVQRQSPEKRNKSKNNKEEKLMKQVKVVAVKLPTKSKHVTWSTVNGALSVRVQNEFAE